ncbi:hypothetical protein M8J77_006703 [Diaphorina citri]|nr:hypothetical protein M8J77_006703 [Diaphorina citri]
MQHKRTSIWINRCNSHTIHVDQHHYHHPVGYAYKQHNTTYTKDSTAKRLYSTNYLQTPTNIYQIVKDACRTQYKYKDTQKTLLALTNNLQTSTKMHQIVKTENTFVEPSTNVDTS